VASDADRLARFDREAGGYFPQYVETGHLVFVSEGELRAAPIDQVSLA
jgi:hypothetical protein